MTLRRNGRAEEEGRSGGFSGFVRSLLSGVPWSERSEAEQQLRFDRPKSGVLRVHNANGRTRVCGQERDDIEVVALKVGRAESSGAAEDLVEEILVGAEETSDALELEVEAPRKWNRRGYANLEIRLPRDLHVDITAANGRIDVKGLRGRLRARSSNGSVHVSDVVGDIDVTTTNNKVCCECTCGRLMARSSNSKIELDEHRGAVDASTSNGLIRVSLAELGKPGVQLATSNGRILLELPEEVDADLDIRVENGVIRNDRELCKATRESGGRVVGTLGRGGFPIKLRTSNGSVCLR